ncbi:hypothetical protein BDA96_04G195700 [Sorghum bicolor]|uniref:Uncharacterized protein n=2 Tax=Sorghum bicolor TaxID=4558 RepID=A0A1Z5RNJ9_SORBI|nr:hypothetical protein BDA96_04G195700 [Sorghum bicolor]OQU85161.1 hypothetical protein SORBI_3004G183701 [Sorghum bicolor]OQU85162.1 hypothetical protein SORBI_3004G183701 [Sorghum bicolor]
MIPMLKGWALFCLTNKHLEAYNTTSWSQKLEDRQICRSWWELATTGRNNMYWKETAGVDGHGRLFCALSCTVVT